MSDTPSPDWAALRALFPATQSTVYLDTARKALLPRCAGQAAQDWFADIASPEAGATSFAMDGVEQTRATVGRVFGADAESIALIRNTSEAMNIVATGLDWKEGDNVVLSSAEHENNTFPWRPLTRRGVELRIVPEGPDGVVSTDALREAVDGRTRVLTVAWLSYGAGQRADLAALAQIARAKDALFVVDAIQALGVIDQRLDDLGADLVAAGGHKGQLSVTGAGLMHLGPRAMERITPPFAAKYSFDTLDRAVAEPGWAPGARRFEYGNPNFLGLAIQRRSADFIGRIGLRNIELRVRDLTTLLIEQLDAGQVAVRTPRPWAQRGGIVSMETGGVRAETLEAALAAEGIRVAAKDGHLRAAVHFYNTEEDVTRFASRLLHHLGRGHR
ncbi:aminotransferase class V-fold PLP-dependent enzyme [Oceanicella sp. SM1341]|uniref:aminotransferase class V-fold PLP-dependent enzyme n=1 Tax=Oceanicella sp. SM1341 TaxID=1548889 RepID=UPI000E531B67|nr:aminotransferase class V-fold PLP-dependent enzyme [Oceanicella sp. SM1341]